MRCHDENEIPENKGWTALNTGMNGVINKDLIVINVHNYNISVYGNQGESEPKKVIKTTVIDKDGYYSEIDESIIERINDTIENICKKFS